MASGHHVGTRFSPTARPEAAFKLWLRHAKPTLGRIVVDDGAALALRERMPDAAPQVIHRDEFVLADARGADPGASGRGLMGGS